MDKAEKVFEKISQKYTAREKAYAAAKAQEERGGTKHTGLGAILGFGTGAGIGSMIESKKPNFVTKNLPKHIPTALFAGGLGLAGALAGSKGKKGTGKSLKEQGFKIDESGRAKHIPKKYLPNNE